MAEAAVFSERPRPEWSRIRQPTVKHSWRKTPSLLRIQQRLSLRRTLSTRSTLGDPKGQLGNEYLWSLDGQYQTVWGQIAPQLDGIVGRTPHTCNGRPSPVVMLHGYFVGISKDNAQPAVIICTNSPSYAKALERTVKRSGVLRRGQETFQVKIRQPGTTWNNNLTDQELRALQQQSISPLDPSPFDMLLCLLLFAILGTQAFLDTRSALLASIARIAPLPWR
ncbi:hypothetical protein NM208_g4113 [Fusarium decemcellulare]|uniref:Uncharacterized protein n=1 Tax=Fusarium decemcellulare TaxID=57161 RepID=A0ACC1SLW5_9HYPO|nr:hypothetical protein NM208_g4113 [Fusarium decemcellulare]